MAEANAWTKGIGANGVAAAGVFSSGALSVCLLHAELRRWSWSRYASGRAYGVGTTDGRNGEGDRYVNALTCQCGTRKPSRSGCTSLCGVSHEASLEPAAASRACNTKGSAGGRGRGVNARKREIKGKGGGCRGNQQLHGFALEVGMTDIQLGSRWRSPYPY
jgi:hypothetical protein